MKKMKRLFTWTLLAIICLGLCACATLPKSAAQIESKRAEILKISNEILEKAYQQYPEAREEVRKAAGYGVFSNFGFKFMFMGSSRGAGVVVDNRTKRDTFMKMFELSPGLGFGAQKFACVFLFDTRSAMDDFVNSGWEFGGNTTAALQSSTQGTGGRLGVDVAPGITMYQLSDEGAIVGVSVTGAKYYKDDELN